MSYPKSWSWIAAQRLPVSKMRVKLQPSTPLTAAPFDTTAYTLPANVLLNLRSIAFHGKVTTTTTAGFAVVPFAEALIDSLAIEIGGQLVSSGHPMYNFLFKMLALDFQLQDRASMRQVLQLQQTGANLVSPVANQNGADFAIYNHLGFLGTSSVGLLDTSLVPQVRILIRWAPAAVLATNAASTGRNYSLKDLYMTCETVEVLDGNTYQQLLQKRVASAPLTLTWTDYQLQQSGIVTAALDQTARFTCAANSLDCVHSTFVHGDANTKADGTFSTKGYSYYFERGAGATGAIASAQYSINSTQSPSFRPTLPDVWVQTMDALSEINTTLGQVAPGLASIDDFHNSYFLHSLRFNVPAALGEQQTLSGINTVGSTVASSWQTFGTAVAAPAGGLIPLVILEHSRILSISPGKQIAVTV